MMQEQAAAPAVIAPAAIATQAMAGKVAPGFSAEYAIQLAWVLAVSAAGLLLFWLLSRLVSAILKRRKKDGNFPTVTRVIRYAGYFIVGINALSMAGMDISAILGAAGIAGIAIGFAAQTSVSNLISGLFLLWERPFQPMDVLSVADIVGEVETIDLLATRIRTFDNQVVRIPNETMIKSNIINLTRYPIRRLNISVVVPYETPMDKTRRALEEAAQENQYCLDNPEPFFLVEALQPNGYLVLFGLWFENEHLIELKNTIMAEIQEKFRIEGIRFAPQIVELAAPRPDGAALGTKAATATLTHPARK